MKMTDFIVYFQYDEGIMTTSLWPAEQSHPEAPDATSAGSGKVPDRVASLRLQ
jgi:hypothetical protein